jgi:CheY-like chemotaxis protein
MVLIKSTSVLIIEDNEDTRLMLSALLRRNGYNNVSTAVDRNEALSILASTDINLILLDYRMSGQSATIFLHRVRSVYPHIRVVLITASDEIEFISNMLNIDEFVRKPIRPEELLRILED